MKPVFSLFLLLLLALPACQNTTKPNPATAINPDESALPHGTTLPGVELSAADKAILGKAHGRTVDSLSVAKLTQMVDSLSGKLYVLYFWSLDCIDCEQMAANLVRVNEEIDDELLQLIFINIDDPEFDDQINARIREQNLTSDCYLLSQGNSDQWFSVIQSNWTGELPAILLLNESEGTRLFYQKSFSFEELWALFEPFTL